MQKTATLPPTNQIFQADCLAIMKKLPDCCIDLVVTDPPYNDKSMFRGQGGKIRQGQKLGSHGWFANDQIDEGEFNTLFLAVLKELQRILKPNSHIYIFCNHKVMERFKTMLIEHFRFINLLVWDKMMFGLGWCYRPQYELILLGSKGANKIKIKNKGNILRFRRLVNNHRRHPTQKPENIISELISNSSQEDDLVFDPFAGSGTTLVAAAKLNRKFLGCEIDPRYFEMAQLRLKQLQPHRQEMKEAV